MDESTVIPPRPSNVPRKTKSTKSNLSDDEPASNWDGGSDISSFSDKKSSQARPNGIKPSPSPTAPPPPAANGNDDDLFSDEGGESVISGSVRSASTVAKTKEEEQGEEEEEYEDDAEPEDNEAGKSLVSEGGNSSISGSLNSTSTSVKGRTPPQPPPLPPPPPPPPDDAKPKPKPEPEDSYGDDEDFVKEDNGEDGDFEDQEVAKLQSKGDAEPEDIEAGKSLVSEGGNSSISGSLNSTSTSVKGRTPPQPPTTARPTSARPSSARPSARSQAPTPKQQQQQHLVNSMDEEDEDEEEAQEVSEVYTPPGTRTPPPPKTTQGSRSNTQGGSKPATTPTPARAPPPRRPSHDSWEGEVMAAPPPRRPDSAGGSTSSGGSSLSSYSRGVSPGGGGGGRVRPHSASVVHRQQADVSELYSRDPETWDVRDVASWVESLGLGAYRKKFMHNQVDGSLLLMLDDAALKQEIGVGPLGHRVMILRAIEQIAKGAGQGQGQTSGGRGRAARPTSAVVARHVSRNEPQEFPRRPASASRSVIPPDGYLGPASGKTTVYEQRSKLMFELDRAAARAAQQKALADQLLHTAGLSEDEVGRLRGLLADLEKSNKLEVGQSGPVGLDSSARVPWRPIGHGSKVLNPNPQSLARPGEDPSLDLTFQPKISSTSRKIIQEVYGGEGKSGKFLDRLETDLKKREKSKKELVKQHYSAEAMHKDPLLAKKVLDKDLAYVNDYVQAKGLLSGQHKWSDIALSESSEEWDEQIEYIVQRHASDWQLKDKQVSSINGAKGEAKVSALAAAIRQMLFMQRYQTEMQQREGKIKELQNKWWYDSMGGRPGQARMDEDTKQALDHFSLMGWKGDSLEDAATDARANALLARVRKYKTELDAWKDKARGDKSLANVDPATQITIDWQHSPWSSDGLWPLMEQEMERAQGAVDDRVAAARRTSQGGSKVVKTQHAGEGPVAVTTMVRGGAQDFLTYTVHLLANTRWDDLGKLEAMAESGDTARRGLAMYRAIRTQKFIQFTDAKIKEKEEELQIKYESMRKPKKMVSKEEQDAFYERLLDDSARRKARVEKLLQDKKAKEAEIIASSKLYTKSRPKSSR